MYIPRVGIATYTVDTKEGREVTTNRLVLFEEVNSTFKVYIVVCLVGGIAKLLFLASVVSYTFRPSL